MQPVRTRFSHTPTTRFQSCRSKKQKKKEPNGGSDKCKSPRPLRGEAPKEIRHYGEQIEWEETKGLARITPDKKQKELRPLAERVARTRLSAPAKAKAKWRFTHGRRRNGTRRMERGEVDLRQKVGEEKQREGSIKVEET